MNHFRSTFLVQMLVVCVIAFGLLAAPFAEASTVAIAQTCHSTMPHTGLVGTAPNFAVAQAMDLRSTGEGPSANLLTVKIKVLNHVDAAKFVSAGLLPRWAKSAYRSCSSQTTCTSDPARSNLYI